MDYFTIPFITESSIIFREQDEEYPEIDMTMDACVTGKAVVSDYDTTIYRSEEDVERIAKLRIQLAIVNCFVNWPKGKSVMRSDKNAILCEAIKKELANIRVTAEAEIDEFKPSARSYEIYTELYSRVSNHNPDGIQSIKAPAAPAMNVSFCGNCGAKRLDGANFCTSCGAKF